MTKWLMISLCYQHCKHTHTHSFDGNLLNSFYFRHTSAVKVNICQLYFTSNGLRFIISIHLYYLVSCRECATLKSPSIFPFRCCVCTFQKRKQQVFIRYYYRYFILCCLFVSCLCVKQPRALSLFLSLSIFGK